MLKSHVLVAFAVLLAACISRSAWATGEEPPPSTSCVDVEKTCVDAGSPEDPISFEVTLNNCGDTMIYCQVRDLLTDEILINWVLVPGETVAASGSYHPDQCGESTNQVYAKCTDENVMRVFDEAEATCRVPCDGDTGCTLTPGYWKTHSVYGPAPYDPTWAAIGEDTPFFLSGISYYEALWTDPRGGNAYYILAHAYIAAQLNVMSGASMPSDVEEVFSNATDLFGGYTPEFIGGLKGKSRLRKRFVRMAEVLDDYNNGISGPGHCDDQGDGDGA